jgi:hypothetical protein
MLHIYFIVAVIDIFSQLQNITESRIYDAVR